jgi:hypothetical protein
MFVEYVPHESDTIAKADQYSVDHDMIYFDYLAHMLKHIPKDQIGKILLDVYSKYDKDCCPMLLINSLAEAPSGDDFDFLDSLKLLYPGLRVIHLTSGLDPETNRYQVITDHSVFFWPVNKLWPNAFTTTVSHHFIALARAPKPHRTRFINSMLNQELEQFGHFSIGSSADEYRYNYNTANCKNYGIDIKNLKHFPTLLDGPVTYEIGSQYSLADTRITQALLNVVLETSYEFLDSDPTLEKLMWRVPFLTEKTVKAFVIGQIPLILGPLGQVKMTRDLGFDLFDDIVDHSYDLVVDPYERIEQFTNSLKNFINQYPRHSLQQLKNTLLPRFVKNLKLAKVMHNSDRVLRLENLLQSMQVV